MDAASRLHRIRYKRLGNDLLATGHILRSGGIPASTPI
jgi:hypothetical protein